MDKQLEQRIRDRAYELWMQNGCLPDRAEDYWYQAEKEILGNGESQADVELGQDIGSDGTSTPFTGEDAGSLADDSPAPVEVSAAPLGMTSQTTDEVLSGSDEAPPVVNAPKARKGRSAAAPKEAGSKDNSDGAGGASKRKRTLRTP
jgi:hypothetical protein